MLERYTQPLATRAEFARRILVTPILHRFMHRFHLELEDN